MISKRIKTVLFFFSMLCINTFAQIEIAGWDFNGQNNFGSNTLPAFYSNPNITVGSLTKGSGITNIGTAMSNAWGGTGCDGNNESQASTLYQDYIYTTIKANVGYKLSLDSISSYNILHSSDGATIGQ